MKKRILSLALALSLLLSMIPAGALSEEAEPAPVEEPAAEAVEEAAAPEADESLAEELPVEPEPPEAEPVEPPQAEIVETAAPAEDAVTEEPGAELATPEPPEAEHPALDPAVEEQAGEAPGLFAPEQSPELFTDSADLRSVAALGSDGVQYAGVAYLSQAAFNSLDAGQQADYIQMVDDITELLDEGVPVTDVVFSLNAEGALGFNYAIPMETFAEVAEMLSEPVIAEEAAAEAVVEEVAEEAVAEEEAIEPEVVQQDAAPEPIVENVELAERVKIPLVKIPGLAPSAPNSANARSFFTLYAGDEDYFSGQLSSAAKEYYDAGKAGIVDGGNNGFTIQTRNYASEGTNYVVDALSALITNYPESFDWMAPGGSVGWGGSSLNGLYTLQITIENSPHYSPSLEQQARAEVNKLVAEAYADAQKNYPNDIDYGVVKYLDAWVCNNNFYNMIGTESNQKGTAEYYYCHSSYGVLLKGYGVCESYARAMSRLLDAAGIPNIYVTGTGNGGGHAWNYVQMSDGKYYMQDSTWNDPVYSDGVSRPRTDYLLCEEKSDHKPQGKLFTEGKEFKFPPLSDTRYVCKQAAAPNPTPRITPEPTHPVFGAKVSSITLSQESLMMAPKEELKLTATVLPDYVADSVIKWTSDTPGVATVGSDGTVRAVAVGSAQITCAATDGSGVSAVCDVTVRIPATWFEVRPSQVTLVRGDSETLSLLLLPSNVTIKQVKPILSDEDEKILSYANKKVTGIGVGKGKITFRTTDGSNLEAVCEVTVTPLLVSNITLSQSTLTLEKGATQKLTASVEPRDADNRELKWTSTADGVATVEDGEIRAISAGQATIRCEAADGGGAFAECQVTVNPRKVSTITLSQSELTLDKGASATLTAEVGPEDADNKALKWTSTASGVATVDGGEVKAVGPGQATIRAEATDGSGKFAECQVTVNPRKVSAVTLRQSELTLTKGDAETLTADIEPTDADNQELKWTSTAGDVATVTNGEVKAVGVGRATIRAEATDGSGAFAECWVTVDPLKISTITLRPSALTLAKGSSAALTADIEPKDADNQELKWTSDAEEIASVEGGEVTAVSEGHATIRCEATDGSEVFAECQVMVTLVLPDKIELNKTKLTLGANGDAAQLSVAKFEPEGSGAGVTYSTNKPKIASVDPESGRITTGSKTGTAIITARTDNGKTATCTVTVNAAPKSVKLNKGALELSVGEKPGEKLTATKTSGSAGTLTWASGDEDVATVDEKGNVTAVGAGTAEIIVTAYNYDPEKPDDSANKKLRASCTVTVKPNPATISGLPESVTLGKAETLTLNPAAMDADGADTYAVFSYESEPEGVATVGKAGKITAKKVGTATVTVSTKNGTTATVEVEVKAAPTAVKITNNPKTLGKGEPWTLETEISAKDKKGNLLDCAGGVTFTSSDTGVLVVDKNTGVLTAKKAGSAKITAKTYNNVTKSVTITVKAAPTALNLKLNGNALGEEAQKLGVKETATLTASFGKTNQYGHVSWENSAPDIVSVTEVKGKNEVALEALAEGEATITASVYNKENPEEPLTASCKIEIKAAPTAENTHLVPKKVQIGVDESVATELIFTEAAGAVKKYKSSNKNVATVSAKGVIKGVKKGTSTITATMYNDVKITVDIEVVKAPTSLTITNVPEGNTMKVGETWTPEFKIDGYGGADKTGVVKTYTSSDQKKASFKDGVLTALKPGKTKITCKTYNGMASKTYTITVVAADVEP